MCQKSPLSTNTDQMIRLEVPEHRKNQRFFKSILTGLILLGTCTLLILFMMNILSDHGHTASKLDRMAQRSLSRLPVKAKGIQNTGNICYASSVAQMLFRIDTVRCYVLENIDDNLNLPTIEKDSILGLKRLFKSLEDPESKSVKGHGAQFILPQFPRNEQGDSEEFYVAWTELLQKVIGQNLQKDLFLKVQLNRTRSSTASSESSMSTEFWSSVRVTFPELSITQNRPIQLVDLLAHSQGPFGESVLTDKLRQIYQIVALPKTLVVSIVRTAYHPKKGPFKINTPVLIPEFLNLDSFLGAKLNGTFAEYQLKMFILHKGTKTDNGHYIAYVQDQPDRWQIIDDENVRDVHKQEALESLKFSSFCLFDKL